MGRQGTMMRMIKGKHFQAQSRSKTSLNEIAKHLISNRGALLGHPKLISGNPRQGCSSLPDRPNPNARRKLLGRIIAV